MYSQHSKQTRLLKSERPLGQPHDKTHFELFIKPTAGAHRAIWFEANVPQNAEPGVYCGTVTVSVPGCEPAVQEITLEVQPATLPAPEAWKMHLDLWQHPQSVARWHDAEPWSTAHFEHLRPLMQRLAAAGQKCITCILLDEAWNAQTYD